MPGVVWSRVKSRLLVCLVSLSSSFSRRGQLGVVMADEGEIVLQGELAHRVGLAVVRSCFSQGLPGCKGSGGVGGPVVSQLMGLRMRDKSSLRFQT